MKVWRTIGCIGMILFLLFTPQMLAEKAQEKFVDTRFVREKDRYEGTVVLYHIVRHRPYIGSLSAWLQRQAEAFEKKHKGIYIEVEGMDEAAFYERLEYGRRPDAYSFFSGSLYDDLLQPMESFDLPLREGLFSTERCVPYCYSGYCMLKKDPSGGEAKRFCEDDVPAARLGMGENEVPEEKADVLVTDLRRAGDLIRYRDGFALSELQPIDCFTDIVCWLGIDRNADAEKAAVLRAFYLWLLSADCQETLSGLGLLSVRSDVKNVPADALLKKVFAAYETVETVEPFRWYAEYDTLAEDAAAARRGDADAAQRFTNRLQELIG